MVAWIYFNSDIQRLQTDLISQQPEKQVSFQMIWMPKNKNFFVFFVTALWRWIFRQ